MESTNMLPRNANKQPLEPRPTQTSYRYAKIRIVGPALRLWTASNLQRQVMEGVGQDMDNRQSLFSACDCE